MAKITELPQATTVTGEDIAVIVQDGVTKKVPRSVLVPEGPDADTKAYADNVAEQAETRAKESAQQYASDAQSAAVNAAKSYTDAAIQTADTAAQGYATTAQENAIQQASTLAQTAQEAAETAAKQYADAAKEAAEAAAQEYADAAEAAAKAASPSDLLLTDRLLQLGVGGEAIGDGVQLPQEQLALWNDITLDEDVDTIEITQTDDGRPLKIKDILIYFYGAFSAPPGVAVNLKGGGFMAYNPLGGSADQQSNWWLRATRVGGGIYMSCFADSLITGNTGESLSGYQTNIKNVKVDFSGPGQNLATGIKLYTYTSNGVQAKIRANSHIRIYGVMDIEEA